MRDGPGGHDVMRGAIFGGLVSTLALPAVGEGEAQTEPDQDAARQPAQAVGEAGVAPQPSAQSPREEGDDAEHGPRQEREGQAERQQLRRHAARGGVRELRQVRQEKDRYIGSLEAFPEDGSTDRFFHIPRSVEARELVADAALGVVDSVDLISPFNHEGAVFLYHRLLSCGLRLAATAGTDSFLSFSHHGLISNPPGWGRVYAQLGDQALSVEGFKEAIRGGRTFVTNGPWLTLEVTGRGPGAVLDQAD